MSAYIVLSRDKTHDPEGLKTYAELAALAPIEEIELVASTKIGRFRFLEGKPAEAVVVMRFPDWDAALAWYESPEYTKARAYRLKSGEFRAVLIDEANPHSGDATDE